MNLKVCGMRDPENVRELLDQVQLQYLGFIFYPKSKRFVGAQIAPEIIDMVPFDVKKVGVFVNEDLNTLLDTIPMNCLDAVQLHGNESPDYCDAVYSFGVEVIKAFSVDEHFSFEQTEAYKGACHHFLFDTKTAGHGGSGRKFDWQIFNEYDNEVPFFLSGGIDTDDVEDILLLESSANLHAIDINSRFELMPGHKDVEMIASFAQQLMF